MSTKSRKRKMINRKAKNILSACMKYDNEYASWQEEILKSFGSPKKRREIYSQSKRLSNFFINAMNARTQTDIDNLTNGK